MSQSRLNGSRLFSVGPTVTNSIAVNSSHWIAMSCRQGQENEPSDGPTLTSAAAAGRLHANRAPLGDCMRTEPDLRIKDASAKKETSKTGLLIRVKNLRKKSLTQGPALRINRCVSSSFSPSLPHLSPPTGKHVALGRDAKPHVCARLQDPGRQPDTQRLVLGHRQLEFVQAFALDKFRHKIRHPPGLAHLMDDHHVRM